MKKKMIIHRDVYISLGMLIFCIGVFFGGKSIVGQAKVLPMALTVFMAIMSFVVFWQGWKQSKIATANDETIEYDMGKEDIKYPLIVYGMIFLYLILFQILGYFVATTIFMLVVLKYLNAGSWKKIVLITIGYVVVSYLLFVKVLNIPIYRIGLLGKLFHF